MFIYKGCSLVEVDEKDQLAMQRFYNEYDFHESSLLDLPAEKGVKHFYHKGEDVFVSSDIAALASHVEYVMRQADSNVLY